MLCDIFITKKLTFKKFNIIDKKTYEISKNINERKAYQAI